MKVMLSAAALALVIALPAAAQTPPTTPPPAAPVPASDCAAAAAPPTLPDGAAADREGMEAGNLAYVAWADSYRQMLLCRRTEAEALNARWQARVSEHNAAAQQLNTANSAWEAEVAEFNARNPGRRGTTRQ